MARLTKQQWAEARAQWEGDSAMTFGQLAAALGVSRPGVSKTAASEGWTKGDSIEVTASTKVTSPKVTGPAKVTKVTPSTVKPVIPATREGNGNVISFNAGKPTATTPPKPPKSAPPAKTANPAWQLVDTRSRGRPTEYKDEFAEMMIDYFNIEVENIIDVPGIDKNGHAITEQKVVVNKFPTLVRFASNIGVTRDTLYDWATAKNKDGSLRRPDFSYAYARARDLQEALLTEGGLAGMYEGRFTVFAAKNVIGWKDQIETKAEVTVTSATTELLDSFFDKRMAEGKVMQHDVTDRANKLGLNK